MTEITQEDRDAAVYAVRAIVDDGFVVGCCSMSETDGDEFAAHLSEAFAKHRIAAEKRMRERAMAACEEKQQSFLSPEYATGQPLSSFWERFACGQCAEAICNLK